MKTFVVMCLALGAMPAAAPASDLIVKVTGGQVRGARLEKGGAVFKVIPYAQPPVGELRWREPMAVKAWTGVRDATAFGPLCAQAQSSSPNAARIPEAEVSKEDCLYLNVWTPAWPGKRKKPVMVYIHGGANLVGSSSEATYDGENLARHDVVLVSLNYRLRPFGFVSHPALTRESPHHASGNQGILDQIAALKWVRANAASFGGDANNVTIIGESAGSLDVSVLMTSHLSLGLFRRVIAQSGSVLGPGDSLTLAQAEKRGEMTATNWKPSAGASAGNLRAVWRAQELYVGGVDPVHGAPANQWVGDTSFRCPAVQQLVWHAAAGNPAYHYEFARVSPGREAYGAIHAAELPYLFGNLDRPLVIPRLPPQVANAVDEQVSGAMRQYWTNFAKTGDPNGGQLPVWPRFDASSRAYIQFLDTGPVAKESLRRPYCDLFMENVDRLMAT